MKSDNYTSNMNDSAVFVKGYSASAWMQVEMANAPRTAIELLRTTVP